MRNVNEYALIQGINNNDEKCYRQLFDLYYARLIYFVGKFGLTQEEVEDIVIILFHDFFKIKNKKFGSLLAVRTYLYRSAKNSSLNAIKHNKVIAKKQHDYIEAIQDDQYFELEVELHYELLERLHTIIEQLPPKAKQIAKLVLIEQESPPAVAKKLNLSQETVYTQLKRAQQKIKYFLYFYNNKQNE